MSRFFAYDLSLHNKGTAIFEINGPEQLEDMRVIAHWPCSERFFLMNLAETVIPRIYLTIRVPVQIEKPEQERISFTETVLLVNFDPWSGLEYDFPEFRSWDGVDNINPFLDLAEALGDSLVDNLGLYLASEKLSPTFTAKSTAETELLMTLERKLN